MTKILMSTETFWNDIQKFDKYKLKITTGGERAKAILDGIPVYIDDTIPRGEIKHVEND